ncbi:beta-galactosidase [Psychrosphaera sp. F3M07]|uniref:beta-galactosidase n=1 Tax=Psychrosphaera sp. F3M07 TaxID=2841560 RepID=UPI001C07F78E|nr:beta-galactosidase [Psychrosphaera sp. F3M07]MBU2918838.1 beta-galactosidase [Psychrosphaera sp. F3M07]
MKIIKNTALLAVLLIQACGSEVSNKNTQIKPIPNEHILTKFIDFNAEDVLTKTIQLNQTSAKIVENQLIVNFHSKQNDYTSISFVSEQGWDWSHFEDFNLAFDISNPGQRSVQVYLDITDGNGDNYTRSVSIPIGEKNTYYAKMAGHDLATPDGKENVELNFKSGLRSNPDTWESNQVQFISLWGKKNLDVSSIKRITLSVQSALHDKTISISNIRLRKNPTFNTQFLTKIVDKYGQNAKTEFAGKIHNHDELIAARDEEISQLKESYDVNTRSKFGGWINGPKQTATGYFRTEKINGKWSLVDPEGYPYFVTGLDIIRLSNTSTMTGYDFDQATINQRKATDFTPEDSQKLNRVSENAISTRFVASELRSELFEWLPKYDEPLGKHYGYRRSAHSGPLKHGETFSFYSANLERKYSDMNQDNPDLDFMDMWQEVTIKRMLTWGFTSFGNWTDPMFYQNNRVPYFANGWIIGDFKTVSSGNDFWAPLPDVFDPKFEERAMFTLKQVADEVKGNPWCVGVFVDNEMSLGRSESNAAHYGIALHTLKRDGKNVPTKAEFTRLMKNKYGSIDNLNKKWNTNIKNWQSFNAGVEGDVNVPAQLEDFSIMLSAYADKYFATVKKAKDRYLPNHMYMGARFPDWGMPKEAVEASAKHVDVISFNVYKEGLVPSKWKFMEKIDMPAIVGEWHNGASDSGLFHPGLIHASSQEDRGVMYKDYMHSVIDNPYFVGAHWFQYMDSPITGRAYDGENYNVGFINVTDTPYKPIVKAAKEINEEMYLRRFKK